MDKILFALALLAGVYFIGNGAFDDMSFKMPKLSSSLETPANWTKADNPTALRRTDMRGYVAKSPAMAASRDDVFLVSDILDGVRPTGASDVPSDIYFMSQVKNCRFQQPLPEDHVANVQIGTASAKLPIRILSESRRISASMNWVKGFTNPAIGKAQRNRTITPPQMHMVDVVVTETSAPVYLILQSEYTGVLWNIQKGPDVFIAQVAIISNGTSGIVNPDFNTPTQILDTTQNRDCAPRVFRKPEPHWSFVRNVSEYGIGEDVLEKNMAQFQEYSNWFSLNFNQPSDKGRIGFNTVNHILVGPMPAKDAPRIPYQAVADQPVYISKTDHVFAYEDMDEMQDYNQGLHLDLIMAAAGGSLDALSPQVMEKTQ